MKSAGCEFAGQPAKEYAVAVGSLVNSPAFRNLPPYFSSVSVAILHRDIIGRLWLCSDAGGRSGQCACHDCRGEPGKGGAAQVWCD